MRDHRYAERRAVAYSCQFGGDGRSCRKHNTTTSSGRSTASFAVS